MTKNCPKFQMATSIESSTSQRSGSSELFTDLDPLGSGRSRPYYDKKDFFTDFKPTATRSGADSGSGPSSLASQPSGPAPLAPTTSSMSTPVPAQLTSSEQLFGRSFSSNENRQLQTTGISAPPSSQTSRCQFHQHFTYKQLFYAKVFCATFL